VVRASAEIAEDLNLVLRFLTKSGYLGGHQRLLVVANYELTFVQAFAARITNGKTLEWMFSGVVVFDVLGGVNSFV
jgi:hypothetical protein